MSKFSVKPTLSMKGRKFNGIRGWNGKPTHPPLTDIPVGAYVLAAGFDLASMIGGKGHDFARTMDSSEAGTQARRTINTHATAMVTVTVLAIVNVIWRLNVYHTALVTPVGLGILTIVLALLMAVGATFGGAMVFEYGFDVETSGDHPAWHQSDVDVFHGQPHDAAE